MHLRSVTLPSPRWGATTTSRDLSIGMHSFRPVSDLNVSLPTFLQFISRPVLSSLTMVESHLLLSRARTHKDDLSTGFLPNWFLVARSNIGNK